MRGGMGAEPRGIPRYGESSVRQGRHAHVERGGAARCRELASVAVSVYRALRLGHRADQIGFVADDDTVTRG